MVHLGSLASLALVVLLGDDPAPAPAPQLAFTLPSAREPGLLSPQQFAGKVLYVQVTRTSCPGCAAQAGAVRDLRARFASRGFEVLTVYDEGPNAGDDPVARVRADADQKGYAHPIALNDGGEFHGAYYAHIGGTPSAFLVSRSGMAFDLGLDPLGAASSAATFAKVEELLASPSPAEGPPPIARFPLQPFSLLSFSKGVIRSTDFTGRPTLLAAWIPGPLMERLGPSLEQVHRVHGDRVRVVAVTFGDFDRVAADASRLCPSIELAAPDGRTIEALALQRLPQVVFLDAHGLVAKRIDTLYGASGIEAALFDRIAAALVAETAVAPVSPGAAALRTVRDDATGFVFELPEGFAPAAPADGAHTEYAHANARIRTLVHESLSGADGMAALRRDLATRLAGYRVEGEETLPGGAVLMREGWSADGAPLRGLRVLVPTPKGLVEVHAFAPAPEFGAFEPGLRSSATSVRVER